jgi:hypothetical protein
MYTLFLLYPSVSSSIFSCFICKEVEGVRYLRADFSVTCDSAQWNKFAVIAAFAILVYPLGVPLYIYYRLRQYAFSTKTGSNRLNQKGTRAQFGFLYDGFERKVWFFELIDMAHKLIATSLIPFFPEMYQLPMAMLVMLAYICTILVMNPYIRRGDDRLHLLAQTELILIVMAGNNFQNQKYYDGGIDIALSIVLICMIIGFFGSFVVSVANIAKKWLASGRDPLAYKCRACCKKEMTNAKSSRHGNKSEKMAMDLIGPLDEDWAEEDREAKISERPDKCSPYVQANPESDQPASGNNGPLRYIRYKIPRQQITSNRRRVAMLNQGKLSHAAAQARIFTKQSNPLYDPNAVDKRKSNLTALNSI